MVGVAGWCVLIWLGNCVWHGWCAVGLPCLMVVVVGIVVIVAVDVAGAVVAVDVVVVVVVVEAH